MFILLSVFDMVVVKGFFTKCFEGWFSKRMVFTMNKLCFVSPEKRRIQLIASEINSLRQVRMIILKRSSYSWDVLKFHEKTNNYRWEVLNFHKKSSNYRWDVLKLQKQMFILLSVFDMVVVKGCFY